MNVPKRASEKPPVSVSEKPVAAGVTSCEGFRNLIPCRKR